jgi:hypothetical protein
MLSQADIQLEDENPRSNLDWLYLPMKVVSNYALLAALFEVART